MTQRPPDPEELARWSAVDTFLERTLLPEDPELASALDRTRAAGMPEIQISPLQGAVLSLLARSIGASRILEIGTLGGYSTTWLARGLAPGGRLISLELSERHAEVARDNLRRAGLGDAVQVRVGSAASSLERLRAEGAPPFDMAFIDADKPGAAGYFDVTSELVRVGGLIVVDNVVRRGDILDPSSSDPNVQGTLELFRRARKNARLRLASLQSVGRKGHDGFLFAVRER